MNEKQSAPVSGHTLPEVADRLAELTARMAQANPEPPEWVLSSDAEVKVSDPSDHVEVTVSDYRVTSLWVDPAWFFENADDPSRVTDVMKATLNSALEQFLEGELAQAMDTHYGIEGVARELKQLSGDARDAFSQYLDDTIGRMPK